MKSNTGVPPGIWSLPALILRGSSVRHAAMLGSVVAVRVNEAPVYLRSRDGLNVGDTMVVYRTRQVGFPSLSMSPHRAPAEVGRFYRYEKAKAGKVRVTWISGEHYATIETLSEHYAAIELTEGKLRANDIVEKTWCP
jgi:hypothetical protein